jgi:hypothetical protein
MIEKKTYFLIPFLPLGLILIGLGLFVIIQDFLFLQKIGMIYFNWTGFLIIALGFSIFLFKNGFVFDPVEKKIQKYISFVGIKFWSKWINLPALIDNVQIIKKKKTMTSYYKGAIPITSKVLTYDLFLVYNSGRKFDRLFSVDEAQAFDYGQIIADSYKVELIKKI